MAGVLTTIVTGYDHVDYCFCARSDYERASINVFKGNKEEKDKKDKEEKDSVEKEKKAKEDKDKKNGEEMGATLTAFVLTPHDRQVQAGMTIGHRLP